MPLTLNRSKELFSEAYVRAVVASAGMHVEPRSVDVDSIDGYVHYTGFLRDAYSPLFGFQLKSTAAQSARAAVDTFGVRLPVKNYRELSVVEPTVPRILIVVILPNGISDWVHQTDERMLVRRCGYWRSLQGEPATSNVSSKTVEMTKTKRFTVQTLKAIMMTVAEGGPL
jgi:Domain of unknown function (DUF4365)